MACKLTLQMKSIKHFFSDESAPYLKIEQKQPFEYNHNQLRPIVHFSGGGSLETLQVSQLDHYLKLKIRCYTLNATKQANKN